MWCPEVSHLKLIQQKLGLLVGASACKQVVSSWKVRLDLEVDQVEGEKWSRHLKPLTYMHRSTYQIMSPKFGYDLKRCLTPKTARLVGQPSLCVARPCLNKEVWVNCKLHF